MSKKERQTTDSRASEQGLNSKPPPPGLFDSLSLLTWTKPSRTVLSNEKSGTRAGRKPCSDGATRRSASIECGVDVADDGDGEGEGRRRGLAEGVVLRAARGIAHGVGVDLAGLECGEHGAVHVARVVPADRRRPSRD